MTTARDRDGWLWTPELGWHSWAARQEQARRPRLTGRSVLISLKQTPSPFIYPHPIARTGVCVCVCGNEPRKTEPFSDALSPAALSSPLAIALVEIFDGRSFFFFVKQRVRCPRCTQSQPRRQGTHHCIAVIAGLDWILGRGDGGGVDEGRKGQVGGGLKKKGACGCTTRLGFADNADLTVSVRLRWLLFSGTSAGVTWHHWEIIDWTW